MMHRNVRLILAAVTFLLACSLSLAGGHRIQVQVGEPFEVDGVLYPSGTLSVEVIRDYNPSSTLNEIWVGNRCLGMVITRKGSGDAARASRDTFVFSRSPEGHLVLLGYDLRGATDHHLFAYGSLGGKRNAPQAVPGDEVLIAAIPR